MLDALKKGLSVLVVLSVVSCGGGGNDNYLMGVTNTATDSSGSTDTSSSNNSVNGSGGITDTTDTANNGDTTDTTGTTDTAANNQVADLEVAASSRQLGSNGASPVTISAIVKDESNNILKDVDVKFAVDSNGTIEPDESNGTSSVKTAELTPGLNRPENRMMVVTVTAGEQERKVEVEVTGTLVQLDGPERIIIGVPTEFVAKLKDSTGAGLPFQVVEIQSASGNVIAPTSDLTFATDSDGEVKFTVLASASGADTLTATALGTEHEHTVSISGDEFTLGSNNEEITVNTEEAVDLLWMKDSLPQTNKQISLTATRGSVPGSVTTDNSGKASFMMSSATAGGTVVTAVDAGTGLSVSMVREFVSVTPNSVSVMADQTNIGPMEQTTIAALVRDANNNPVKNEKVNFNIGQGIGVLSSSLATTDSQGRASVVYTATNNISELNGVEINVRLPNHAEIVDKIALTVGRRALRIVIGADEMISEDGVFYVKEFGVLVTDSGGNPVEGTAVSFTVSPIQYVKGYYKACNPNASDPADVITKPRWYPTAYCDVEDTDRDGWLDPGEDDNNNSELDPSSPAVNFTAVTDAEGRASAKVRYLQSEALWSKIELVASISVGGTEYQQKTTSNLPVLAADVNSCDINQPNDVSPYGISTDCAASD